MTPEIKRFNEFLIECAESHTVFQDESLRQFMDDFITLYEQAYGELTQNETHIKVSTWYKPTILMRYVRESIRRRGGVVNMHKAYGQDVYWFEVPKERKPPVVRIINDPRKEHPDSANRTTSIIHMLKEKCKGKYVYIQFKNPDEFSVHITDIPLSHASNCSD